MSRLFTADVHAVLDRIEEPGRAAQARDTEMEEELAHSEQRVRQLEHERTTLADRHRKVQAVLAELTEQLDVCFANGNDELARKIVKRRLETDRLDKHVAERRTIVDKQLADRRAACDEQREHLDVMRQKAELLAESPSGGDEWAARNSRSARRGRGRVPARAAEEESVMSAREDLFATAASRAKRRSATRSARIRAEPVRRGRARGAEPRARRRQRAAARDRTASASRTCCTCSARSGERVGRVTTIACWLAAACVAWLAGLPLVAYVLVHVGLAWLVRSLYYYSGVLPPSPTSA